MYAGHVLAMRKLRLTKISLYIIVSLLVLLFSACQPTPDEPVIVNKNDGKLDEALHESPAPVKPYEVPPHWTETVNNEKLKIVIDTDISLPDVDNYPVVKLEAAKFTQQRVDELVDYFAKGKKLYLPRVRTKADYEEEIVQAKQGTEVDGKHVVTDESLKWVKELEARQAAAPADSPKTYTDTTLTYYRDSQTGEENIASGKNFLSVMVENADGDDATISVGNYVRGYNLSASFSYFAHQDVYYVTESNYHNMLYPGGTEEEIGWEGAGELFDKVEVTRQEAEGQAQSVINGLGIRDLVLVNADKAVSPEVPDNCGYQLTYMRQCGGMPAYMNNGGAWHEGEAPPEYSPPLDEERLIVLVTKSGVMLVGWRGCADVVETVSENVELLPFEDIQQALKDQIFYKKSFDQDSSHGMEDRTVSVTSAELRMGYIGVKDNVNQALMVPVWVFETEGSQYNTAIEEEQSWQDYPYVFNAIDGGVIEPNRLDNLLC